MLIVRSVSSFALTKLYSKEISQINLLPLSTGLPKFEYNYWLKLLRFSQQSPASIKGSTSTANLDDGNYSLGKRLSLLQEEKSSKLNQNLSFKAEFTKEYILSSKIATTEANIIKIGLVDYYSEVTIVETNSLFQLFLLGTTKGKIKCVIFTKNEENNKIDNEVIREERTKREKEVADINAAANNSDPIINDEFFFNLTMVDFIGHHSVITAISLKYNSSRFVSGSIDGELRLWDVPMHTCLAVYKDHFEAVFCLKMAPKDDLFASAGSERILYLWKENSGRLCLS